MRRNRIAVTAMPATPTARRPRDARRLAAACIGLLALAGAVAIADPAPVRFGVFPRWNAQIVVRDFSPLALALSRHLGRDVRIETDKDFDSFMRRVRDREFDLIHTNQLQYLQASRDGAYRAIAKLCDDPDCTITALIVVRRDSKLTQADQLRGKTIAFGDRGAMVSYVLATSALRARGLEPAEYRSIFTKNPPNALLAVYNGYADAAGVGTSVFRHAEITGLVDFTELRVLARGRSIPHLPIAVRSDLDPDLVERLRDALLTLERTDEGRAALGALAIERIAPATDAEYRAIRDIVTDSDFGW